MNLIRKGLLIVLLVIAAALFSYQTLKAPTTEEIKDDDYLDSKLKNELEKKNQLSNLIVEEKKKLIQQENHANQQLKLRGIKELELLILDRSNIKLEKPFKDLTFEEPKEAKLNLDFDNILITNQELSQSKVKKRELEQSNSKNLKSEKDSDVGEEKKEVVNATDDLFLGIKDGYVAIYKGDVLGESELIEVRKDIPLKFLVKEDVKRLQLGIKVDNKTELFSILEGFLSAKN